MGRSMAGHLQGAGHYAVQTGQGKRRRPCSTRGRWHDSAGSAAAAAEVVITMLGFPQRRGGVISGGDRREGAIRRPPDRHDDLEPAAWRGASPRPRPRGLAALDAPVSGGDIGAREARLVIMVGWGRQAAFGRAQPSSPSMGRTSPCSGPAGAGQHCKMANQIAVRRRDGCLGRGARLREARGPRSHPRPRQHQRRAPPEAGPSPTSRRAPSAAISRRDST